MRPPPRDLFPRLVSAVAAAAARAAGRARDVGDLRRVVGAALPAGAGPPAGARRRQAQPAGGAAARAGGAAGERRWRAGSRRSTRSCGRWSRRARRWTPARSARQELVATYSATSARVARDRRRRAGRLRARAAARRARWPAWCCSTPRRRPGSSAPGWGRPSRRGRSPTMIARRWPALLSARRSYLHIFAATAPRPAEELLARALASTVEADLARAEDLILAGPGRGDRPRRARAGSTSPRARSSSWARSAWRRWDWWRPSSRRRPAVRAGAATKIRRRLDAHRVGTEAHGGIVEALAGAQIEALLEDRARRSWGRRPDRPRCRAR